MPQQTNRVHIRRICILAIAAVALAALTPLANADNDDPLTGACCTSEGCSTIQEAACSIQGDVYLGDGTTCADCSRWRTNGFVEIQIDNHPNNHVLGNLYLYIDGYNSNTNPTNIVPYSNATQTTGLGFYKNGTGVTYLVDDYKSVGMSETRMLQHEYVDHTSNTPGWRGFRINTMTEKAGMNFTLAFGCDERHSLNNGFQYDMVMSPGACFNYDAPIQDGSVVGPKEFNQSSVYHVQKGFAQRCAVFEIAFNMLSGNSEDEGDLTDIDFYGFPMNVSGQASSSGTSGSNGLWSSSFTSKKYKLNDKWIRQQFKTLMKNNSGVTGPNWYYAPSAPSGHCPELTGKFVRAVSPHAFPTLTQDGGDFWSPVPENFKFPASYFEWFTTSHSENYARNFNCITGEHFVLESPLSAGDGHTWSQEIDAFQATACVCLGTINTNTLTCTNSESGDGKSLDHYSIKFTYTALFSDLDMGETGGGDIFDKFPAGDLEIYCIVPNGPDSHDPNYTGWSHMENFILGGDPGGSGAEIVVMYEGTRINQHVTSDHHTTNKILGWDYTITGLPYGFGHYCYANGIKTAFGQLSSAITNGWIDNPMLVKNTQRGTSVDYFYEQTNGVEAIGTLDVAKMEFLEPIYGLIGSGSNPKWYDQYGSTILAAQDTENLVAYASAYTDAYKYGNVLFPTHKMKFNTIKLTIPDLSGNCDSNFSATGAHNLEDILILMNSWGSADCDLNGDMTTDVFDLLQLLTDWGKCS